MAYLPLPISADASSEKGQVPFLSVCPSPPSQLTDPIDIFSALRQALVDGTPPDPIFRNVAEAAQTLTSASGVALALRSSESVICRARSGEIAPAIDARLDVESGISGQCFRTSKALRCDDTQTDDRVDPEVCRYLGIRSIAVVPLRGYNQTVGILEVFSDRTYAFADHQISLLKRLAEIVEVAYEQVPGEKHRAFPEPWRPSIHHEPAKGAAEALPFDLLDESAHKSPRHFWVWAAVLVLMILMVGIAWISWYEPDDEVAASEQVSQSSTAPNAAPKILTALSAKPAPGKGVGRLGESAARRLPREAANRETDHGIVRPEHPSSPETVPEKSPQSLGPESVASPETVEAPEMVAAAPDNAALDRLVSVPSMLPGLDVPVSQGVTEAVLLRRVLPSYPPQARAARIEGSVILETTITEDGATRDVKVVSGPAELALAATEAVSQWRYRPAQLNGKPASVQKQITILFKAP